MNKKVFVFNIFLILFFVSCNGRSGNKVIPKDSAQNEVSNSKVVTTDSVQDDVDTTLIRVYEKMGKMEKLTDPDYDYICDFLLNNRDESLTEGMGYYLFKYLKNNQINNSAFESYLNGKEVPYRKKINRALVQVMCIDIGEGNYTYSTFIKDFSMLKNSVSAKNAFYECLKNLL